MLKYVKNTSSCPVDVTYFRINIWSTEVLSDGMEKKKAFNTKFHIVTAEFLQGCSYNEK